MKIILHFSDMAPAAEETVIEWINEIVSQKGRNDPSPLRYADKVEVVKEN
jgi:hypothetical protein